MRTWKLTLAALAVVIMLGGMWFVAGQDDPAAAQPNNTWLAETDVRKADLPAFLETIDVSCDVDVEPQGMSEYIVAYRCPE